MEGTAVERTSGIAGEQSLAERVNAYILSLIHISEPTRH